MITLTKTSFDISSDFIYTVWEGGLVANLNLLAKYAQNKMLNLIVTYFHTQVHLLQNLKDYVFLFRRCMNLTLR